MTLRWWHDGELSAKTHSHTRQCKRWRAILFFHYALRSTERASLMSPRRLLFGSLSLARQRPETRVTVPCRRMWERVLKGRESWAAVDRLVPGQHWGRLFQEESSTCSTSWSTPRLCSSPTPTLQRTPSSASGRRSYLLYKKEEYKHPLWGKQEDGRVRAVAGRRRTTGS